MRKIFSVLLLSLLSMHSISLKGQEEAFEMVSDNDIRSVRLYRSEWNLSYPVIRLGSDDRLTLNFDLLGNEVATYYYSFIHCDKDWNVSDIYPTDYLEGFPENPVEEYSMSFNTTVNYVHYSIDFPSNDINFTISGNYLVNVFPIGEPDNPIIVKRFMVSEERITMDITPQRSKLTEYYNTHQQVDLAVKHPGINIRDPYRSLFISILQNGRWETSRQNLKPDFIGNQEIFINDLSGSNLFPGLSEYRYFDIKSLRYQTEFIKGIDYQGGTYNVLLQPSENRTSRQYFYWPDQNGKYYIAVQEGRNHETESDYVHVYFTLPYNFPLKDEEVYLFGGLTGWRLGNENRMVYNYDEHAYECSLLLKQGWYNYLYVVKGKGDKLDFDRFEGSHYETENDYLVLVYLREPMERFDRLIGSGTSNSVNR